MRRLALILVIALALIPAVSAANQAAIYAEDSNGWPVYNVEITVSGVNNDYHETKNSGQNSNYAQFFDYKAGEKYEITVRDKDSQKSATKTVKVGPSDNIEVNIDSSGGDGSKEMEINLESPDSDEKGVSTRPKFQWSIINGDNPDLTLYIEKKDYSSDKPWDGKEYSIGGSSYRPSESLNPNTDYVWGIKAANKDSGPYRYFTTGSASNPSVSLEEPDNGDENVDRRTSFEWSYSGDKSKINSVKLYVEERDYSGDSPWGGKSFDITSEETSFQLSSGDKLDSDTEYTWGVEIKGDNFRDRAQRYFTTGSSSESNEDPSLELENPNSGEKNIGLRPIFEWRSSDSDSNSLQHNFYIEKKSYDGDKPWSSEKIDRNSNENYRPSSDLEAGTWYVWGVEVLDGEGGRTLKHQYFKTQAEESNSRPSVNLHHPTNGEKTGTSVDLRWGSSDPDNDNLDHTVYVEEKDYSSDKPWDGSTLEEDVGSSTSYRVTGLDRGQTYVWGVEASDGSLRGTAYEEFTVRSEDGDGSEPEPSCNLRVDSVSIDDHTLSSGDSTEVSLTIESDREQEFKVLIKSEEGTYYKKEIAVDGERTITKSVSPENDVKIYSKVEAVNGPCGYEKWESSDEIIVAESHDDSEYELTVDVEDEDGDNIENARVELSNGVDLVDQTGSNGKAYFSLENGDYNLEVSKDGYSDEDRDFSISGSDKTIDVTLKDDEDSDDGTGQFTARVVDENNNRLENARVQIENSENSAKWTDEDGEAEFELEAGHYQVSVWKNGYGNKHKNVEIEAGEEITKGFKLQKERDIKVSDFSYPENVCRGSSVSISFKVSNMGDSREVIDTQGSGLGTSTPSKSVVLSAGESKRVSLIFTGVQGSGSESFRVTASNGETASASRTVKVQSCGVTGGGTASDISLSINPDRTLSNQPVKVKGYVDGARGRSEVKIKVDGKEVGKVSTQPDGYYQSYIRVGQIGQHSISVETRSISANRELEVLPTASVSMVNPPQQVFEGEEFEICANVNSQITPEVLLLRDGVVMQSEKAKGQVCFTPKAKNPGEHIYTVRALTSGQGSEATAKIKVLETAPEASSFPEQLASVESESGLVKAELYNTHDELKRYSVGLEGLPDDWVSTSEKEVILDSGERETIYFYIMPKEEGSYSGDIVIESQGSEIYRENVTVWAGGTTEKASKGWFSRISGFWPL